MLLLGLLACILAAAQPPQVPPAPDWDALRLPDAVAVVGVGFNNGDAEPFDKIVAEIGPSWARTEQHLRSGTGFRLYETFRGEDVRSMRYCTESDTANASDQFRVVGAASAESLLSPVGYIRIARRFERDGGTIDRTLESGLFVYGLDLPRETGMNRTEIAIDPGTGRIVEVRHPSSIKPVVIRYSEWNELPDGTRHPTKIEWRGSIKLPDGTVNHSVRETRLESMRLLNADHGPSPLVVPDTARILNGDERPMTSPAPPLSGRTLGRALGGVPWRLTLIGMAIVGIAIVVLTRWMAAPMRK